MRGARKAFCDFYSPMPYAINMMTTLLTLEERDLLLPKSMMLNIVEEAIYVHARQNSHTDIKYL